MPAFDRTKWLYAAGAAAATVAVIATAVALTIGVGSKDAEIALALTGGNAGRAPPLLRRYGCGGCHTIPGVPGADGQVGPPLGQFRQRVFIAGSLPNTADNLVKWVARPSDFHPGSAMPDTGISNSEARDVAAFLYQH
jgi:cytochrome c